MNQYTFNLETNYLQHNKQGAHYSKNWNKEKQDEYNAKYYKEHKDKWGIKGGYSETNKEIKYTGQIGDYGKDDLKKLEKDHGELGDDNWLGEGGDVSLSTTEDGTKVLLNGDSIVASGKDLDGVDTKVLGKYLTDIYAQAGDHATEKGLKTGTKEYDAFWKEFNTKVNDQLKGLIAKQKQVKHDDFIDFSGISSYLSHHGILGMHWGDRNGPPYPLGSDDYSSEQKAAARKAGIKIGGSSGKGSIENLDSSSSSSRVNTIPKEQPEEHKETPEEHEAKRKAALSSGDKKQIKKYATESSYVELSEALNKANLMEKLNEIPDPPKESNFYEKLTTTTTKMKTVYNFANTIKDIYNLTADVKNVFVDDPKKKWKKIGGDSKKNKVQHSFSSRNEFYSNLDVETNYLVDYDFFDSQVEDHNQFSFNLSSDYLSHHGIEGQNVE